MYIYIFKYIFLLLSCAVLMLYFFFRHKYGYWRKRGVSSAEPTIFFGNLSFLMRSSISDAFRVFSEKKSDYLGIYLSWKPTLLIQSKEYARKVLVTDSEYFQDRYSYAGLEEDPLGSLNLFSVKGKTWIKMRAGIMPMFTRMRLKQLTELINRNSMELVKKIQRDYLDTNTPIHLKSLFAMYTSDNVAFTVFGLRVSALKESTSPLWRITGPMAKWSFWRGVEFSTILFLPWLAKLIRLKFFSERATNYIRKLFYDVVERRKGTGQSSESDLVNQLLKLKDNLKLPAEPDSQLADDLMLAQAALFIFAAIGTSSTTICYCLHELAHNLEKQEKLFQEVDAAIKSSGKQILDFDELSNLKYLKSCILETLRKYPPVPFLDRICNKTYKLNDEVTIEKGTPVFVNVIGIHHSEDYFPEPGKWLPERFVETSDADNLDFTFLPFGGGPRNCMGFRYGLMQVSSAVAHMVAKYRFESRDPHIIEADPYSFLLTPKTASNFKFVAR
ncbi:cytochrome P450 6k1-like [Trichoplusia ni]|uniref:unspecific monooxygenase n=1 Tax=Trichoplusia ni TaxID=7111 RepID=A0A7E5VC56_TRINI|nr:cytochrome P450 6k1-like [Trichoplusia ni]